MLKLARSNQQKAQHFLATQSRPLEQSLFAYYFQSGSREAVLAELAKFQNTDGGFGHALEPDLRLPDSSVIATTVALQILRSLQAQSDQPLVQGALRYLLDTYDSEQKVWPIAPSNTRDAPCAPWWSDPRAFDWRFNPRPEIIGYFYDYADLIPANSRDELIEAVVVYLESLPDLTDQHDSVSCYARLAETTTLPETIRARILDKLKRMVALSISRNPADWGGYVFKPLKLVHSPDSPFAALLADVVALNLDYEIERQGDDGAWGPNWSWSGNYPEVWEIARREWQGRLTLDMLLTLRAFDRLE